MLHATDGFGFKGWMVTELHLQGAELLTFALVHQFAQSGAGVYKGNTSYLRDWTGWAENTCRKHLTALVSKGLLSEIRGRENNTPFCHYVLAPDFYEKHPSIFEVSPRKNCGATPQILQKSTPQILRGEYNSSKNIQGNNNPPTPQEVAAYAKHLGFADPDGFAAYYCSYQTENGWMMGKGKNRKPIDNWKLNVVSWSKYHKNESFPAPANATNTTTMSKDDFKRMFASK